MSIYCFTVYVSIRSCLLTCLCISMEAWCNLTYIFGLACLMMPGNFGSCLGGAAGLRRLG